ncbi:AlpA family phage regulatory protein [Methylophilaceae bacterium]|nr:AlpA family phage regulatory protein [Methylophilaceae bacterium]
MNQRLQKEVLQNFEFLPKNSMVRLPTVMALYGLSKSTILREIKKGNLPSPIKLTARTSAWKVDEIRKNLAQKFRDGE